MDYQMALLCLRATPLDSHLSSPEEILYNRKIRTRIPTLLNTNHIKRQLNPRMVEHQKQQQYFHRNAKDLPELMIGSKVSDMTENQQQ